jgi:hypothetical protein
MFWVVDPTTRTVVVHEGHSAPRERHAGDVLDGGDVLPGFVVPVDRAFEVLD